MRPVSTPEHPQPGPDSSEPAAGGRAPRRPEQPTAGPEKTAGHPPVSEATLSQTEREEKEKVRQEIAAALKELHGLLKTRDHPSRAQITACIDQTPLLQLTPIFKRQLASAIDLRRQTDHDRQAFVRTGLEVLDFWIHLQALKRGADRQIGELRSQLNT